MKKFILIGETGCGADIIAQTLASDEQSYVFGEIFHNNLVIREKEAYRKTIGGKSSNPIFACYNTYFHENTNSGVYVHNFLTMPTIKCNSLGFIMYHANLRTYPEAEIYLKSKSDIHIIHVMRNPLHSLALSKMDMIGEQQIYLSFTFCRDWFKNFDKNKERMQTMFTKHPMLEMHFPQEFPTCMKEVNTFLTTNASEGKMDTTFCPDAHIINYNLLKDRFNGTSYEQYFKSDNRNSE